MQNRGLNHGVFGSGKTRLNVGELKSKSEDEKVDYLVKSLTGQIKKSCEELNLDLTGRYKLIKKIMDSTKEEVIEYTEKIKKDLNTFGSISDDIDVEDDGISTSYKLFNPNVADHQISVYGEISKEEIFNILMESELGLCIKDGYREFEYNSEKLYIIKEGGGGRHIVRTFTPNDFKELVSKLCLESKMALDSNKELKLELDGITFNSRGIAGRLYDCFTLEISN